MTAQSLESWEDLFGGTAYIDPNDFGPLGYAALPALLLVFRRVCVYSPYPPDYEKGVTDDQLAGWLNLSWYDFESFALGSDPSLKIVARPDYARKADLRAARGEFRDRVQTLPVNAFEANAQFVLEHAGDLKAFLSGVPLPPRYQAVYDNKVTFQPVATPFERGGPVRLPDGWSASWKDRPADQRVLMAAAYDCRNDHIGISAGDADRPFLSVDHLVAVRWLLDLEEHRPALAMLAALDSQDPLRQFVETLRTALPVLVEIDDSPVTRDRIQRFRAEQQPSFWRGFDDLSHRVRASRPEQRAKVVAEWARERKWAVGVPGALIGAALGFVGAAWLTVPPAKAAVGGALIGFQLGQRTRVGRKLGFAYCGSRLERLIKPVIRRPPLERLLEQLKGESAV